MKLFIITDSFRNEFISASPVRLFDVTLIKGYIELTSNFPAGSLGDAEKLI